MTAFTAALDERFRATVVSGYANTFQGSILDRNHCLDNYVPGILREAELPDLIGLIVPRPLFIEAGSDDPGVPNPCSERGVCPFDTHIEQAGAAESLDADFFTGGHEISGAKAYDWLDQVL